MAPAERQWQILATNSHQIWIADRPTMLTKGLCINTLGQCCEVRLETFEDSAIGLADKIQEVSAINLIVIQVNAAAHNVKQGVRKMTRRSQLFVTGLNAISTGNDRTETLGALGDVLVHCVNQVRFGRQPVL